MRRLLPDEELRQILGRPGGRGERALGGRGAGRPSRARPSRAAARSSSPTSACCPSSSARASAVSCSTGRSATPGGRGRAGSGSTPAISTTRGRSPFTETSGFRVYDQRLEQLELPAGMRPPERPRLGTWKPMRILMSVFSCGPHRGSEEGVGWNWAVETARPRSRGDRADPDRAARPRSRPSWRAGGCRRRCASSSSCRPGSTGCNGRAWRSASSS